MKIKRTAAIVTIVIAVAGLILISPLFFRQAAKSDSPQVMLLLTIAGPDTTEWSAEAAALLYEQDLPATAVFTGEAAAGNPGEVAAFGSTVDIGSQTYSGGDLPAITDYTKKLEAVTLGKAAVDTAGNLTSAVFRAADGRTDDDIYSLLSRNGILVDFSYDDHYNVYEGGQFIRHEANVLVISPDGTTSLPKSIDTAVPLIVRVDSTVPIAVLDKLITDLEKRKADFVNAADLTGLTLTKR